MECPASLVAVPRSAGDGPVRLEVGEHVDDLARRVDALHLLDQLPLRKKFPVFQSLYNLNVFHNQITYHNHSQR